jgi:hypothetical protein
MQSGDGSTTGDSFIDSPAGPFNWSGTAMGLIGPDRHYFQIRLIAAGRIKYFAAQPFRSG